jgi:hypothetical protein
MRKLSLVFLVVVIGFFSNQAFGQQLSEIQFVSGSQIEILSNGTATLDVSTAASTGGSIHIYTKSTTTTGIYVASSSNYVGIGTATPDYKLEVNIGATAAYPLELVSSGRYLRIGALNSSYAHFDTDATGGFYFYDPVFLGTGNSKLNLSSGDSYLAASGGKVGIGTSNPSSTLHVVTASGNAATFSSAITIGYPSAATDAARKDYVDSLFGIQHWVQSGSYLYTSSTAWNVGIGTATPATKLDVYGTETGNRISQGGSGIPYTELIQRSWGGDNAILFGAYGTSSYANGDLLFAGNTRHKYASSSFGSADHRAKMIMADHTSIGFYISNTSGGVGQNVTWNQELLVTPSNIYIPTNSVGIGVVSPGGKLEVESDQAIGLLIDSNYAAADHWILRADSNDVNYSGLWETSDDIRLLLRDNGGSIDVDLRPDGDSYIMGNVGIGTVSPISALDVRSSSNWRPLTVGGDGGTDLVVIGNASGIPTIGGHNSTVSAWTNLAINPGGGNVGIGTTSPSAKLDVNGTVNIVGSSAHNLRIAQSNQPASYFFDLDVDTAVNGRLNIKNQLGNEIFSISRDGVVGIGTTTPASKLVVYGGDIQVETGMGRFKGWYNAGSGLAAEIGMSGGEGYVIAYNRTTSAYSPINLSTGTNILRLPTSGAATLNNGLTVTGTVTATQFVGGGAGLTGITATDSTKVAKAGDTMSGALTVSASVGPTSTGVLNVTNAIDSGSSGTYFGAKITGSSATFTNGSIATSTALYLTGGNTGHANNLSYALQAVAGSGIGSEYAAYFGGNVGINTTAPGYALDVVGDSRVQGYLRTTGSSGWINETQGGGWYMSDTSWIRTYGSKSIYQNTGTFRTDGNFQIGAGDADTGAWAQYWDGAGDRAYVGFSGAQGATLQLYANGTSNGMTHAFYASGNVYSGGSTGIGTSTPATKLHLFDASSGPILTMSGLTNVYRGITIKSTANAEQWFYGPNTSDNFVIRQSGTTDKLTINSTGVGVGAVPLSPFHVAISAWTGHDTDSQHAFFGDGSTNGGVRIGFNTTTRVGVINVLDPGGWWGNLILQSAGGNVGLGTTTPATKLQVVGTITATKLNADEVDPPYTINGKKYATYMAGMTGLKEETSGVVTLKNGKAVLDLMGAEENSDLWMFTQTINLAGKIYISESGHIYKTDSEKVLNNIVVLLTPSFDGRVWYEKKNGHILINSSEKSGEISYRLTAPRFDAMKKDGNLRTGDEVEGLNFDKLLK